MDPKNILNPGKITGVS
ncbi:MAG: hypothetical protein MI802_14170 [Desulfobacterales bacterium]|nr:hypothetical protein [Desulfobacterales bacterium]